MFLIIEPTNIYWGLSPAGPVLGTRDTEIKLLHPLTHGGDHTSRSG